ncbi:hypothetical protein BH11BAC3_BH11BAC3_06870 [soil metagenome]
MWTKITDCGKQLIIHSKIRELAGDQVNVYTIVAIEFDQYKVELIETKQPTTAEKLQQTLNCTQLLQHGFEIETGD